MEAVTIEGLEARQEEIRSRLEDIDRQYAGEALPDETKEQWNSLNLELDQNIPRIEELKARKTRIAELSGTAAHREAGASFNTGSKPSTTDIYDLISIRNGSVSPDEESRRMRDNAMRAIEIAQFPHESARKEDVQGRLERLVTLGDTRDAQIARHLLVTGSPVYQQAFAKYVSMEPLTHEEQRAMSLTGSAGGFAVPFVLDPTIIPTSSGAVNPFRALARVEQITVDEWRGVSSSGVTASYQAELTEAGDNSPTFAQPVISTEKAQSFIPFSIEIGMDFNGLSTQLARLLQDAKDALEATKFAVGTGVLEPQGVLVGATQTVVAGGVAAFAVGDLYALEAALPPRWQSDASLVLSRPITQRVRQFGSVAGANVWLDNLTLPLGQNTPEGQYNARILGYPAYESSAMDTVLTTGSKIAVIGDFDEYVIVDRIGLTVELIPHLLHTANNRPYGARGLYAYWRNGAGVLTPQAFRTLITG